MRIADSSKYQGRSLGILLKAAVEEHGSIQYVPSMRPSNKAPYRSDVRSSWLALLAMVLVMLLAANLLSLASAEGSVDVVSVVVSPTDVTSATNSENPLSTNPISVQGIEALTDTLGRTTATTATTFSFSLGGLSSRKVGRSSTLESISKPSSATTHERSLFSALPAVANTASSSSATNLSVSQNSTRNATVSRELDANAPPFATDRSIAGCPRSRVATEFSVVQNTVTVTVAPLIDAAGLDTATRHLPATVFITGFLSTTPSNTSITALTSSFPESLSIDFGSHNSSLVPALSALQSTTAVAIPSLAPAENQTAGDLTAAIASVNIPLSNIPSTIDLSPLVSSGAPNSSLKHDSDSTALTRPLTSLASSYGMVSMLESVHSSLPPFTTTAEHAASRSPDNTENPPTTSMVMKTAFEQTRVIPVLTAAAAEIRRSAALNSPTAEALTASSAPMNLPAPSMDAVASNLPASDIHLPLAPSSVDRRNQIWFSAATSSAPRTKPLVQNVVGNVRKGAVAAGTWLVRRVLGHLGTARAWNA